MADEPSNGARRSADLIIARLEGKVETLVTTVMEIRTWLMGSGTPENPGVMIRLDRLEQVEMNRKRHLFIVYTAITGILVHAIYRSYIVNMKLQNLEKPAVVNHGEP